MHFVVVQGTERLLDAAIKSAARVSFVATEDRLDDSYAGSLARSVAIPSLSNEAVERAVREIHRHDPVHAVLSLTEAALVAAAHAAASLGLKGLSQTAARTLKDKVAMRRVMTASSLPSRVVSSAGHIAEFIDEHGTPVILKPRHGTASSAVYRIDSSSEINAVWSDYVKQTDDAALLESFAVGEEYSVEAFSHNGHHHVIACTEKVVGENFVELGHIVPAQISAERERLIIDRVSNFLDDVGVSFGPSHTEVRVDGEDLRVIESHNRVGGDKIGTLVLEATGIDLVVKTLQGLAEPIPCDQLVGNRSRGAAIRFLHAEPGIVDQLVVPTGLQDGLKVHLDVAVGDHLNPLRSSIDRAGYVIASASTAAIAASLTDSVLSQVKLSTVKVPARGKGG